MRNEEIENWWSSRNMSEKFRIASKLKGGPVSTPGEATRIFFQQTEKEQKRIMQHCIDEHRQKMKEWNEGKSMSY